MNPSEKTITEIHQRWLSWLCSTSRPNKCEADAAIVTIYNSWGLPVPEICYAASPIAAGNIIDRHEPSLRLRLVEDFHYVYEDSQEEAWIDFDKILHALFKKHGLDIHKIQSIIFAESYSRDGHFEGLDGRLFSIPFIEPSYLQEELLDCELGVEINYCKINLRHYESGFFEVSHHLPYLESVCAGKGIIDPILQAMLALAKNCHRWYLFEDLAVLCEKPVFNRHPDSQLDPTNNLVWKYADGYALYAKDGTISRVEFP